MAELENRFAQRLPGGRQADFVIASGIMLMVLFMTNTPRLGRFTGLCGGTLVFRYITFEAPLSGMSINPARTVASALPSGIWTAGWIYLVAPIGGMLLAVDIYQSLRKGAQVACAKWNHDPRHRCICCGHPGQVETTAGLQTETQLAMELK